MNAETITPQQAYDILATVTLTPNEADQIAALIRTLADDLAAIELAAMAGTGEMHISYVGESGFNVRIDENGKNPREAVRKTIAEACRARHE